MGADEREEKVELVREIAHNVVLDQVFGCRVLGLFVHGDILRILKGKKGRGMNIKCSRVKKSLQEIKPSNSDVRDRELTWSVLQRRAMTVSSVASSPQ